MMLRSFTKSSLRIFIVTSLLFGVTGTLSGVRAAEWTPKSPPPEYDPSAGPRAIRRTDYIPAICKDKPLDCVESIAAYIDKKWVEGIFKQQVTDGPATGSQWQIPGLKNRNDSDMVYVYHLYNYTGNLFLTTRLSSSNPSGLDMTGLQSGVKFRVVVRTSWVVPSHTAGAISEARTVVEKLETSGASRITVEGIPEVGTVITDQTNLSSPTGKSERDIREFSVAISDGRFYPLKQECFGKPAMTIGHDGYGPTSPKFEKKNLDLNVTAPHFLADGVTLNEGFYEALIPLETASCLWGVPVTSKTDFGVTVVDTEGSTKPAVTKVTFTDDAVIVTAKNFTYSSPTVRVNVVEPTVATTVESTTTVTPTASQPTVAQVTSARTAVARRVISATFTRVAGTTYKATVKKAKVTKKLTCKSKGTKMMCVAPRLTKGTWTLSITPTSGGVKGTSYTKKVKVP